MKRQAITKIARMTLATTLLIGVWIALATTPALAVGLSVDPTTSGATGEWLDVLVGFGMLLVIGLGGLWFSQHQMKFR